MFSRKSVMTVALTAVMLLAMLVPAAMAAPELLHGVVIDSPTTAAPVWVSDTAKTDNEFDVDFTVTIVGTQEYGVKAKAYLLDEYGVKVESEWAEWSATKLKTGANALSIDGIVVPHVLEGMYDVKVCVWELLGVFDEKTPKWCATQADAVMVDWTAPKVWLDKPGEDMKRNGVVWVTGQDYLLVGGAVDNESGIDKVWFEYRVSPYDENVWIQIPTATYAAPSGVANEYQAVWDSTLVRDDYAWIRICATDMVGYKTCSDAQAVFVENRYTVNLRPGWNLISTPLMLYNKNINDVMFHLTHLGLVESVWTTMDGGASWPNWMPAGPGALAEIKHGQGYWIKMKGEGSLTFTGTWKSVGPVAPPQYMVNAGWNLIGYTHWGQPTHPWFGAKMVSDYLGLPMATSLEALWMYDAASEIYVPMWHGDQMVKGAGYWLATAQPGTINP